MLRALKQAIQNALRYTIARRLYDRRATARWEKAGRPIPPPYAVKRSAILELAGSYGCHVMVETGTFMGDTMYALRNDFRVLISIELDPGLHARAQRLLRRYPQLRFVLGDSSQQLPEVILGIDEPVVFWLDGHYSGPGTARGSLDSPIWKEIDAIFAHQIRGHVVLIDDARDFIGAGGYPTIQELRHWVAQRRPDWVFKVEHDIIRIHPPSSS